MVEFINSPAAAAAKLPFSQAVRVGDVLYLSGAVGTARARWISCPAASGRRRDRPWRTSAPCSGRTGSTFDDVFKCTVMLADMSEWADFNAAYVTYFQPDRLPARSAFGASGLALGALVEVECMAHIGAATDPRSAAWRRPTPLPRLTGTRSASGRRGRARCGAAERVTGGLTPPRSGADLPKAPGKPVEQPTMPFGRSRPSNVRVVSGTVLPVCSSGRSRTEGIVSDRSRRLAIAGTLLIAVVLAACGDAAAAATPQPTPTPIPTPAGGEHLFTVANQQVALTLNLPPGWEADASSARRTASNGTELEISVWAPSAVYADPCHWQGTDVEVGPEVTDLVSALAAQPMRQARDATVDVAGIDAHRLFMSVPKSLDLATCDGGEFRSWLGSGPADARVNRSRPDGRGLCDRDPGERCGARRVLLRRQHRRAGRDPPHHPVAPAPAGALPRANVQLAGRRPLTAEPRPMPAPCLPHARHDA